MNKLIRYPFLVYLTLAVYCPLFIYIVFFLRRRRGHHIKILNLIPFKDKWNFFTTEASHMNYGQWKSYGSDIIGNVLLFIPLSFFLVLWLSRKEFKRVILVAIATSILIETIQFIFEIGVADIDDVILNVTGAAIGFFITKAILGKPLPY